MNTEYKRDSGGNFLIINLREDECSGYECAMLESNRIDGLLALKLHPHEDGKQMYYDITSKQPFDRLIKRSQWGCEEIKSFAGSIIKTLKSAKEYLIPETELVLDAEYVYVDPATCAANLCVVPGYGGDFLKEFSKLLEKLLECVNHKDSAAVMLAYGLYQQTKRDGYCLEDIESFLYGSDGGKETGKEKAAEEKQETADRGMAFCAAGEISGGLDSVRGKAFGYAEQQEDPFESFGDAKPAEPAETGIRASIGMIKEKIKGFLPFARAQEDIPAVAAEPAQIRRNAEPAQEDNSTLPERPFAFREVPSVWQPPVKVQNTGHLLPDSADEKLSILHAQDSENEDIRLLSFPFIIGRQEEMCDHVLKDDNVSRMHLRLDRCNDVIMLQDLNSTNGTYLNGRLLENNEISMLSPGDEIVIAGHSYRYMEAAVKKH